MTLREKLMHYTHDLDCGVDLKQEAIATIEHIAQYMDEDELLHHSRPLAIAYLALTEDDSVPVVHGRWIRPHWKNNNYCCDCSECGGEAMHRDYQWDKNGVYPICPNCGAKMDGGDSDEEYLWWKEHVKGNVYADDHD